MYSVSKIKRLRAQAQAEIDEVIKKYEPLINDAIKAQIPKGHKLYSGIGSVFCRNKNNEEVGCAFSELISVFIHPASFNTVMNINDVGTKWASDGLPQSNSQIPIGKKS